MLPWQLAAFWLYFISVTIYTKNVFNGLNFSLRFGINELYSPDLNIYFIIIILLWRAKQEIII